MLEILEFIFRSFWHFIGFLVILFPVLFSFCYVCNTFFRHLTMRKYGYPPVHCDSDGEFKYSD